MGPFSSRATWGGGPPRTTSWRPWLSWLPAAGALPRGQECLVQRAGRGPRGGSLEWRPQLRPGCLVALPAARPGSRGPASEEPLVTGGCAGCCSSSPPPLVQAFCWLAPGLRGTSLLGGSAPPPRPTARHSLKDLRTGPCAAPFCRVTRGGLGALQAEAETQMEELGPWVARRAGLSSRATEAWGPCPRPGPGDVESPPPGGTPIWGDLTLRGQPPPRSTPPLVDAALPEASRSLSTSLQPHCCPSPPEAALSPSRTLLLLPFPPHRTSRVFIALDSSINFSAMPEARTEAAATRKAGWGGMWGTNQAALGKGISGTNEQARTAAEGEPVRNDLGRPAQLNARQFLQTCHSARARQGQPASDLTSGACAGIAET